MSWEKRVEDIMESLPAAEVQPDSQLRTVLNIISEAEGKGKCNPTVLVREGDLILGTVSSSDILSALQPRYTKGRMKMEIFWEGLLTEQWHKIACRAVTDVMKTPVIVDANDTLMKASHKMTKHNASVVLVADLNRIVGAVSVKGLFRELNTIKGEKQASIMASAGSM